MSLINRIKENMTEAKLFVAANENRFMAMGAAASSITFMSNYFDLAKEWQLLSLAVSGPGAVAIGISILCKSITSKAELESKGYMKEMDRPIGEWLDTWNRPVGEHVEKDQGAEVNNAKARIISEFQQNEKNKDDLCSKYNIPSSYE